MKDRSQSLVSIGMPVYNQGAFLEETIVSLLNQNHQNIELILSDNASTDSSAEICRYFARQDKRIQFMQSEKNIGPNGNSIKVLNAISGDFYMFASGHDLYQHDFIKGLLDCFNGTHDDVIMAYSHTQQISRQCKELGVITEDIDTQGLSPVDRFKKIIWGLTWCTPAYGLYRTSIFQSTWRPYTITGPDRVFLPELGLKGTFVRHPEPRFLMRYMRPDESYVACKRRQINWFVSNRYEALVPTIMRDYELVKVVQSSELSREEKKELIGEVLRWHQAKSGGASSKEVQHLFHVGMDHLCDNARSHAEKNNIACECLRIAEICRHFTQEHVPQLHELMERCQGFAEKTTLSRIDAMPTSGQSIASSAPKQNSLPKGHDSKRISFIIIVLNGMPFLEYALRAIYAAAHEIIVVEGAVEKCMFNANPDGSSNDGTLAFLKSFADPDSKVRVIHGRWPEKCEMQNKALEHVTGDFVWLVDSDEIYKKSDIEKIQKVIDRQPEVTQINFVCDHFWKGYDYVFSSPKLFQPAHHFRRVFRYVPGATFTSHRPPTMVHPGHQRTTEQMQLVDGFDTMKMGVRIYHYSYVTDAQVQQKVELYRRYGWGRVWGVALDQWYSDFYQAWTPDNRQVLEQSHPIWPSDPNSYSIPFKGTHPGVMQPFTEKTTQNSNTGRTSLVMRHVIDSIETILYNYPYETSLRVLETGTIRSYHEKHESTRFIAETLGRRGELVSVDIDPNAIQISKDICRHLSNITWVLSDATAFIQSVPPKRFHVVLLDSVNDPNVIYQEFTQVITRMASGGILIIDDAGIREDGKGTDLTEARKGHEVWRFLKECQADFTILPTVSGHSTQLKLVLTTENLKRIQQGIAKIENKPRCVSSESRIRADNQATSSKPDSKSLIHPNPILGTPKSKPRHLIIDGVIFQLQANKAQGISRVWSQLIEHIVRRMPDTQVTVLQRKGYPVPIAHVDVHEVPAFEWANTEAMDGDDYMLGNTCRTLHADWFVSTYYTRAPGITNVVMVHDMIPERMGFNLSQPEWTAKQRAIEMADAFLCVSKTTQDDLMALYPHAAQRPVQVAYNGVAPCFRKASEADISQFLKKHQLDGPYVMLVGNRHGYKNGVSILNALASLSPNERPTVLCIGGETEMSPEEHRLKHQLDMRYVGQLDDESLVAAYGGALALLVPSLYEGFGLPVVEAMACGCPVVAHPSTAVTEIGADAILYADASAANEVQVALKTLSSADQRKVMIEKGYRRAAIFDWSQASQRVADLLSVLVHRRRPLISAIVSTYNAANFMEGCLEDLLNQTIADQLEIMVVDSASTQDEEAIVREFQKRHGNIKYMRTPVRESVYRAWNRGILFAAGRYITNANTDDRHRHDAFELMTQVLENDASSALVYADVIQTRTANETFQACTPTGFMRWPEWKRHALIHKGCFIGPQPVWRRNVHDEYGFFDEHYRISADYEFWLRISQSHDFHHLPETLGLYMERQNSIEHSNKALKKHEDYEIHHRYARAANEGRTIGPFVSPGQDGRPPMKKHQLQPIKSHPVIEDHAAVDGATQGDNRMYSQETILKAIEDMVGSDQKEAAGWAMDKMLADYPNVPELHAQRAAMAYDQGDMGKAMEHFDVAASLAPDNATIQRQVGDFFYVVQKDAQRALDQYEKALAVSPDDVETLMLAGHLAMSLHRYPQARQFYTQAHRIDPENKDVEPFLEKLSHLPAPTDGADGTVEELYASAHSKAQAHDGAAAIELLEHLIKKEPNHALSHNDLGVLYYDSGDMPKAQAHYERACLLASENELFQKNLGDFYWNALEDSSLAMKSYVQALKLNPQDVETLLSCAQICLASDRASDARDFLDAVHAIEPWNEDAKKLLMQLDSIDDKTGHGGTTEDLYQQAKNQAASGNISDAITLLNQILEDSPNEAQCLNDLGVLYYETGEKEKALEKYAAAVDLAPTEPTYLKNLADFYLVEQGRFEDAMKLYLRVLEKNPEDVEALLSTGLVCLTLNKFDDARHFYYRALEIDPDNASVKEAMAQLYEQAGWTDLPEGNQAVAG